jgi:hypothetical protein
VLTQNPPQTDNQTEIKQPASHKLKILGLILTIGGVVLFFYFVHSVGAREIYANIIEFGIWGFAFILFIYAVRIAIRAFCWTLTVYEPFALSFKDAAVAVIIGEALSSMIPLGIIISGTAKAVAVRKKIPLVVGLSSIATENLFYSVATSLFLILGAYTFIRTTALDQDLVYTIDILIAIIGLIIVFIVLLVLRQWHFASETLEALYRRGILAKQLEHLRLQARLFENLIYGFYRRYPRRLIPLLILELFFHVLGVLEVWVILTSLLGQSNFLFSFFLESVSRLITIIFKLVPFLIGVDEAGARLVAEAISIGAGVGITLALIRKGRILFWTAIGMVLILRRGLRLSDLRQAVVEANKA